MKKKILIGMTLMMSIGLWAQETDKELDVRYNQYGVEVSRQKLQAEARDGILVFESKDQNYKLWFDTRAQIDAAAYWGLKDGFDKIGNGGRIRRARFAIKVQVTPSWYGEVDMDFANGNFELKDAIVGFTGLDDFTFRVGNFKEGFSMESTTSSRYLALLERPMVVQTFAPSRHLGVEAEYAKGWWRGTLGVFMQGIEDTEIATNVDDNNKDYGRNQGLSYTAKMNFMPQNAERTMGLHFGGAVSYRTPKTDASPSTYGGVRYSVRNSTSINRKKYIDTDVIKDVDHDLLYGFELAGYMKGVRFQSEYIGNRTKTKSYTDVANRANKNFKGWYAYAGYLLFGGQQRYNSSEGEFTGPGRGRSWGDLELIARYDYIDLNSQNIMGGSGENYTVGLNYFVNNNVKFALNYQYSKNDRYANGRGRLIVGHDADGVPTTDYTKVSEAKGKAGVRYHMLAVRMEINF